MLKPFKVDGMEWTRRTALQAALACAAVGPALAEPAPRATSRLILLGTGGGPTPKAGRSAPAQVILVGGDAYVIDCGNGVARQLVLAGVPLKSLRSVFLTHHHSDHNADYGNLLLLSWAASLSTPVDTYGPPPLKWMTKLFLEMNDVDIRTRIADEGRRPLADLIRPHEISVGGPVMRDANVNVTAALVEHPRLSPAFAYRFDCPDRSIVISGDTRPCEQVRAGTLKLQDFFEAESCMHRSHGHCMTMGTASTMASMVEALGIGLPGNAAYPAVDGRRNVLARNAGRRIVEMVHTDQKISQVLTREAFENAICTLAAIGGSTNAVIHLIAIAGRLGLKLTIDDFERLGSELPCLLNLQPSGEHLMEDFCYAGGLPVVMKEIEHLLHKDIITVSGHSVAENIADAVNYDPRVIKTFDAPFKEKAGIAILRGNLAPRGAVIKPSAATPALMTHTGRAVVFEDSTDFHARIDDENLDVDETCILVLKNCGPKGYPGMAEVGNMPLPPKVLRKGITDMVRISDARMSGTAYGTVVLHTTPEAAAGGPLAVVQNGDMIELNVPARKLQLLISDEELAARLAKWKAPEPPLSSGYWKLYVDTVLQADQGADLDFLVGQRGSFVPKDNH